MELKKLSAKDRKAMMDSYNDVTTKATSLSLFCSGAKFTGPNPGGQELACKTDKHELIISGANHSGKTYIGVMKGAMNTIPERDKYRKPTGFAINPFQRIRIPADGVQGWISTYSNDVQKTTVQEVVDKIFKPYWISDPVADNGAYKEMRTEGGVVFFKWQTAGENTYTGAKLNWAHLDEPHEAKIYSEVKARIALRKGYMWTTMTPVVNPQDPDVWKKAKYIEWMINELITPWHQDPESVPHLLVIYMDLLENKFIADPQFIIDLYQSMPEQERTIRLTGQFIGTSELSLFNVQMLNELDKFAKDSGAIPEIGELDFDPYQTEEEWKMTFIPSPEINFPDSPKDKWALKIWEHPIRKQLNIKPAYFIGVDASIGKAGRDYSAVYVRRMDTRAIVAAIHGYINENELAYELWKLGHYYLDFNGEPAMIAIEVNNAGKATLGTLMQGNPNIGLFKPYPRNKLYRRPSVKNLEKFIHVPSSEYGWYTAPAYRGILLTTLRDIILFAYKQMKAGICVLPDRAIFQEARDFIQNEAGKYQASPNHHDDRLFALGISEMALKQGIFEAPIHDPPERKFEDRQPSFIRNENGGWGLNWDAFEKKARAKPVYI